VSFSRNAVYGRWATLLLLAFGPTACSACSAKPKPEGTSRAPDAVKSNEPVAREILTPSTLELSGVAWSDALGRYLVVSDDVNDGEKKHPPHVFALSPAGDLDPSPLVVRGLDELNDPESICPGPEGTFFVTTSHSRNTKGKSPASRRMLLHLALRGRELEILGRVDLTDARTANGRVPWATEEADLELARGLVDIEGLSFRDGVLYLGLKAPLVDGAAQVLRLTEPVKTLASGKIPVDGVALFRKLRLCPGPTNEACEGIADLVVRADGSLVVVGNLPKGASGSESGGALWKVAPGKDAAPVLVHRFGGLKPEGLSLRDGKSEVVVVFDRDKRQPMWVSWPL
jgi:hypothetical protein